MSVRSQFSTPIGNPNRSPQLGTAHSFRFVTIRPSGSRFGKVRRSGHACGLRTWNLTKKSVTSARPLEAATEDSRESDESPSMLGVLLADESNLRHSAFINGLVRRLGCRDFDELWDHLFESRAEAMPTGELVGLMATYCDLSRASHEEATLRLDATLAREAAMVDVVRAEFKRLKKPTRRGAILVVTGGFHTVALAAAVDSKGNPHRTDLKPPKPGLCGSWLIRYSYDQLDALSGYRSGMPSPGFYDALWQADRSEVDRRSAVARLISTIARQTRGKPIPHEASVTDSIAAVQMLDRLADLRGHLAPTRSDLLDAIAACMRKENAAGNDLLASITHKILAGDRVGVIPPEAGQPPIVDHFQRLTKQLRLPSGTIEPRGVNLDLYRKPEHRRTSFLFHQLQLLDVPYASFVDGPDFINAHRLGKRNEEWSVAWTPSTEARLAECASMGDTVPAAAVTQVIHLVQSMDEDGGRKKRRHGRRFADPYLPGRTSRTCVPRHRCRATSCDRRRVIRLRRWRLESTQLAVDSAAHAGGRSGGRDPRIDLAGLSPLHLSRRLTPHGPRRSTRRLVGRTSFDP